MIEREGNWWQSVVEEAAKTWEQPNPKLKSFLSNLDLERKDGKLWANTPEGRRTVFFSTINSIPVVAYQKGIDTSQKPIIAFVFIPGLPWNEITRAGLIDKLHWGGVEE